MYCSRRSCHFKGHTDDRQGLFDDEVGCHHRFQVEAGRIFRVALHDPLGIPVAALGLLKPELAGAAMALSSVSVVSNTLLLRRWTPRARD